MHIRHPLFLLASCTAGLAFAQDPAPQQPPPPSAVYRCGNGQYGQAPCTGGQLMNGPRVSRTFEPGPPPQDRARQMARAQLPPETQKQCATLEAGIRREEARQKTGTRPLTEAEEGDLAIQRVTFREMRC